MINSDTDRPKQFVIDFLQDIQCKILIQVAKCIILLSAVMMKRLCMQVETIFKCLLILANFDVFLFFNFMTT